MKLNTNAKILSIIVIPTMLITLVIAVPAGYFIGYDHGWEKGLKSEDRVGDARENEQMMMHEHEQVEAQAPIPSVDLTVHEDPQSGWNAQIVLTNFSFASENVSTQDIAGEGHAHIYVDGKKINRVYSQWYHIGELSPGDHEISVRISTNDHKELLAGGELITDSETIHVHGVEDESQPHTH